MVAAPEPLWCYHPWDGQGWLDLVDDPTPPHGAEIAGSGG
jgi:hypothetical protein